MSNIGLQKDDVLKYEGLVLKVISRRVELSATFDDGAMAYSDELLAGEFHLTKLPIKSKLTDD